MQASAEHQQASVPHTVHRLPHVHGLRHEHGVHGDVRARLPGLRQPLRDGDQYVGGSHRHRRHGRPGDWG